MVNILFDLTPSLRSARRASLLASETEEEDLTPAANASTLHTYSARVEPASELTDMNLRNSKEVVSENTTANSATDPLPPLKRKNFFSLVPAPNMKTEEPVLPELKLQQGPNLGLSNVKLELSSKGKQPFETGKQTVNIKKPLDGGPTEETDNVMIS